MESIEELARKYNSQDPFVQAAFIEGYNQSQKWISVEDDTLPPMDEKTQIICENKEQYIGYFNGADKYGKYFWFCDNNDYNYPTHWRYLPTPPQH